MKIVKEYRKKKLLDYKRLFFFFYSALMIFNNPYSVITTVKLMEGLWSDREGYNVTFWIKIIFLMVDMVMNSFQHQDFLFEVVILYF